MKRLQTFCDRGNHHKSHRGDVLLNVQISALCGIEIKVTQMDIVSGTQGVELPIAHVRRSRDFSYNGGTECVSEESEAAEGSRTNAMSPENKNSKIKEMT